MSKVVRERLDYQPYARRLADLMACKDWTVEIVKDSTGTDDELATVARTEGRKVAIIRLSEPYLDREPEVQRQVMAHEITHLHLSAVDFFLMKKLSDSDYQAYRVLREYAVDAIADGWAPFLPLPSEILGAIPEIPALPATSA